MNHLLRFSGAGLAVLAMAGLAFVGQQIAPAGQRLRSAVEQWLTLLSADQKSKTIYPFNDPERFAWHFVPLQDKDRKSTRKGLGLEMMNQEQRNAVLGMLRAALSQDGFTRATTIMSLEAILHELEGGAGAVRNPDWYFVTVFGEPGPSEPWGWRIEGHHVSLNFTVVNDRLVSATPAFLGANPATVRGGAKKGTRALGDVDDALRALLASLSDEQRAAAKQTKLHNEIEARVKAATVGKPQGIPCAEMTPPQRDLLVKMLKSHLGNLTTEMAEAEWAQIARTGLDSIHFAYAGSETAGKPTTFRIQGPTFLYEFLNVQADAANNPANHIHTCWRTLPIDFGLAVKQP